MEFPDHHKRCGYWDGNLDGKKHAYSMRITMFVAQVNFSRVHSVHGKTPGQAANLADQWTIEEMLVGARGRRV
jgi:hypothetical protein